MEIDEDLVIEEDNIEVEEEIVEKTDNSEEPEIVQDEEDAEEDRIVTIGDEEPEDEEESEDSEIKHEPQDLVKKLRKVTRGLEKKNKALQRQIEANKKAAEIEKPVELGEKPTLAGCKYDDAKFEQEIIAYDARKRKVESQAAEKAKLVEKQNEVWQNRQKQYVALKQEHSFKDFEEAEETVSATFSQTQQGIIVQGAEDAALVVYALGKNPKKLKELAEISDPVDFAFKVAKLESQLKVVNKKAPKPEKRITSGSAGGISGNTNKTLERLREAAAKSGDYTEVTAYKNKLRKGQ